MAVKNITDVQVLRAYEKAKTADEFPYDILAKETGEPWKVCYRAMERACRRGLIDYGVSLRCGWITDDGKRLLADNAT